MKAAALLILASLSVASATGSFWSEKFGHANFDTSDPRFLKPFLRVSCADLSSPNSNLFG